ncbi:ADP-ribosylglycohydrolase family protein [Salinibacterium sp. SWN248]|uniref:ADP-ribosylglycohydrolase family protein n=1 Tax=Salinibacterium sp. SWN248 TaxID=2792056 RepID=UPI0018CD12F2|nr:ADP-ribosylglycohydrolase family protein [Salinibacterium sp. SWN248]MBH0022662.1 ADP-ribosylglycohydrolase family protein [Salinibacterium sp. SWN248]
MKLSSAQTDRATGVMLAMACGDALGAGYEFGPPFEGEVSMKGGGGFGWAPGEWTDDTSMAVPILRAAASGRDLRDEAVLDEIVAAWVNWAKTAPDVGVQTSGVLRGIEPTASAARASARRVHDARGRSGGNGSLMRTAPVALAYLGDATGLAEAARAISDLTHFDEDAGDACVLWSLAIRHAILTGEADVRVGLSALAPDRAARWAAFIADAETRQPRDFTKNGWVVEALQAAWSAIVNGESLVDTLERAVRGGRDADTVAAIAGGLMGAHWGLSAIPAAWQRIVHGWPNLTSLDLVRLSTEVVRGEPVPERIDYTELGDVSTLVRHPHDAGVWLGAVGALDALPPEVDAVVSLCRIGSQQVPARIRHRVEVRLIDKSTPSENPNLLFVLADAADAVAALRAEGHTVLLHCVQAHSRTPTVAALYAARHLGVPIDTALAEVRAALPNARPNGAFRAALADASLVPTKGASE